jgi:hypothetical protein
MVNSRVVLDCQHYPIELVLRKSILRFPRQSAPPDLGRYLFQSFEVVLDCQHYPIELVLRKSILRFPRQSAPPDLGRYLFQFLLVAAQA